MSTRNGYHPYNVHHTNKFAEGDSKRVSNFIVMCFASGPTAPMAPTAAPHALVPTTYTGT